MQLTYPIQAFGIGLIAVYIKRFVVCYVGNRDRVTVSVSLSVRRSSKRKTTN